MLPITARNCNSDNRNCARCCSAGNVYEMESVKTHRRGEYVTLHFHPDCFEKYQHAKLCMEKGIGGVEYDLEGKRINIERVLSEGTKFNGTRDLSRLAFMLKDIIDPEAWVKSYMANKEA